MSAALVFCPFCGEDDLLRIVDKQVVCQCGARGPMALTDEGAAGDWNDRAPDPLTYAESMQEMLAQARTAGETAGRAAELAAVVGYLSRKLAPGDVLRKRILSLAMLRHRQ